MAAKFAGQPPTNGKASQCESAKHNGERCPNSPIKGLNVCRLHGGGHEVARATARERMAELVAPSIAKYRQAIHAKKADKHIPFGQQMSAAKFMLEVNGYKPTDQVIVKQEFDATRFAHMSDEDVASLVGLLRKASKPVDVRETGTTEED